jgi:O-succinylbenzoic acid--CoA ligase
MVARGYRDMPHHPAFVRHPGERYRTFVTDDLAHIGGHRVSIVGRIDDVIVTGGVKIDPAVVESVLVRVAGVTDVVITGVPDAEWGNTVVAVVQAGPDLTPDLATIRAAAAYAQGPAAAPKHLVLVSDLPRRGPGKPDRAAIGELARRELARREPTS